MTTFIICTLLSIVVFLLLVLFEALKNDEQIDNINSHIGSIIVKIDDNADYRERWRKEVSRNIRVSAENAELKTENKYLKLILEEIKKDVDDTTMIFYNGMPYTVTDVVLYDEANSVPHISVDATIYPPIPKKAHKGD